MTVDQAVEQYLEHLAAERGREERTIRGYRQLHDQWFAPEIGRRRLRDINEATIDSLFGDMRKAGLSKSRMNHAKSLYKPLFRWAKRRRIIRRNPMADFELPKSSYIARQGRPPEVDQLSAYLYAALEVVPDIAVVLALGATTGMRRGELVVRRRDQFDPPRGELEVDTAADVTGVKQTKTDRARTVALDEGTVEMLLRHIEEMDQRAAATGTRVRSDAYLFSLELDCSTPMPADYFTKRVAVLKEHLGIADKRPHTIALEDQALALFRGKKQQRQPGRRGPAPKGAMSFEEIGRRLGRTGRWASLAIAAAERRENAAVEDIDLFDGSILGLRKFTSSELLDSGFNIAAVAERQGHGPQVLAKHYAKGRRSADRQAAEHLGRLIHKPSPSAPAEPPSL
jgi:site-specific recombinase XerD